MLESMAVAHCERPAVIVCSAQLHITPAAWCGAQAHCPQDCRSCLVLPGAPQWSFAGQQRRQYSMVQGTGMLCMMPGVGSQHVSWVSVRR